ncbi:MAG: glutamine synthetase type III, partial [Clostridia bacterium]|nr:glutamine synthetase type III [Clostridia bacterium]
RDSKGFAYENETLNAINDLSDKAYYATKDLETAVAGTSSIENVKALSMYYKDEVLSKMERLRSFVDKLENLVAAEYWCYPTYGELLFGV